MAIIRYQPDTFLQEFRNEMNKLFNRDWGMSDESKVSTSQWLPAVDIKEEDKQFTIIADIPGVTPDDLELHTEHGELTISGKRQHVSEESGEDFARRERISGSFYRRFSLPDTADTDNIEASYKHGVLTITIPKTKQSVTKKIEVKAEE